MKKEIEVMEKTIKPKGTVTITEYKAGTHAKAAPYVQFYNTAKKAGLEKIARITKLFIDQIYEANRIHSKPVFNTNMIMKAANVGLDVIIQRLLGTNTYSLNLTYGEIGTGVTAPAITDVALTTPVARASLNNAVSQNIGNNQAQIQFFFPDNALTNSTYTEFGCFIDGTATLGSGQLFNHSLFTTPYTKSAGTDITVQVNITLT